MPGVPKFLDNSGVNSSDIVALRPYPEEPDANLSLEAQARELEYLIIKKQIREQIGRGQTNANLLVKKFYDPTNPFHSKEIIGALITETIKDTIEDYRGHSIYNEVLGFWAQNDLMIEIQNDAIADLHRGMRENNPIPIRDLTALINSNASLWKDRIGFFRFLGLIKPGIAEKFIRESQPEAATDAAKMFEEMNKEADEFEEVGKLPDGGFKELE